MSYRRRSRWMIVAITATAVVGLAGCSSGGTSTNKATPGDPASAALVNEAKTQLAADRDQPTFGTPGPSLNAASLKGKQVLVVAHDQNSAELVGIAKGIQAAGDAAGVTINLFNGNGSVSAIQQGMTQGIQQHVGAIILDGVATDLITSSLTAAAQAQVPVVTVVDSQPDPAKPGQGAGEHVFGNIEPPYYKFGQLMAYTAIEATGGKVQAAVLTFNNPIADAAVAGLNSVLLKCSGCKVVATQNIEPSAWSTDVPRDTAAAIRSNPGLNYVFPAVDSMGIFATTGVRQAGSSAKVHVVSSDGSGEGALSLVKKGDVFVADPGSSPAWLGWATLDQAMRGMLKMAPATPTVPHRYLDSATLASVDVSNSAAVYGASFEAGYKKLWGIGS